jgi:hypothetical protein
MKNLFHQFQNRRGWGKWESPDTQKVGKIGITQNTTLPRNSNFPLKSPIQAEIIKLKGIGYP